MITALTRVTIQRIKSLSVRHVTNRDVFLFINSNALNMEKSFSALYFSQWWYFVTKPSRCVLIDTYVLVLVVTLELTIIGCLDIPTN